MYHPERQYYEDYSDEDIGCAHCGALCFIYAEGSTTLCISCAREMDDYIESQGGVDKCMNCGKYKTNNQLTEDQVCRRDCINPNEY